VNKTLNQLVKAPILWEKYKGKYDLPDGVTIQQYMYKNTVNNMEEVIQKIQEFINKLSFNKHIRFTCQMPLNIKFKVIVDIASVVELSCLPSDGSLEKLTSNEPDLQEDCFLNQRLTEIDGVEKFLYLPCTAGLEMNIWSTHTENRRFYYIVRGLLPLEWSNLQNKIEQMSRDRIMGLGLDHS